MLARLNDRLSFIHVRVYTPCTSISQERTHACSYLYIIHRNLCSSLLMLILISKSGTPIPMPRLLLQCSQKDAQYTRSTRHPLTALDPNNNYPASHFVSFILPYPPKQQNDRSEEAQPDFPSNTCSLRHTKHSIHGAFDLMSRVFELVVHLLS